MPNPAIPLGVVWRDAVKVYRGYQSDGTLISEPCFHGVLHPGQTSIIKQIWLQSTCGIRQSQEILRKVKLYLQPPAELKTLLLTTWPSQSGGVDISFDRGVTWTTFSQTAGNPDSSSTWISLPAGAIGLSAAAGTLTPEDTAILYLRVRMPQQKGGDIVRYQFSLAVDFEVY